MAEAKAFNWRNFTSFMVTAAFLISVVSGVVLYIVPEGRIAYWVNWELVGMTKSDWADLHIVFAVVFIVGGIFHLFVFNWVSFKAYLAKRIGGKLQFGKPRRELVVALALSVFLAVASIGKWQPAAVLFDLNETAKAAWVTSPDLEPPFGHAEESSLAGLAKKLDIDLEGALAALRAKGFAVTNPQQTLAQIAAANGVNPMAVYQVVKPFERKPDPAAMTGMTVEDVDAKFAGTGIGRKMLGEVATMVGIPIDAVKARLAAAGMKAGDEQTLKDIADAAEAKPMDVLKTILVEGYKK